MDERRRNGPMDENRREFSNGPIDERRREFSNGPMDERRRGTKEFSNGLTNGATGILDC